MKGTWLGFVARISWKKHRVRRPLPFINRLQGAVDWKSIHFRNLLYALHQQAAEGTIHRADDALAVACKMLDEISRTMLVGNDVSVAQRLLAVANVTEQFNDLVGVVAQVGMSHDEFGKAVHVHAHGARFAFAMNQVNKREAKGVVPAVNGHFRPVATTMRQTTVVDEHAGAPAAIVAAPARNMRSADSFDPPGPTKQAFMV